MKRFSLAVVALAVLPAFAEGVPTATVTSFAQDADGRAVRIGYALANAPAIVTMTIEQKDGENWLKLGGSALRHVTGKVNCLLREDGAYSVVWRPDKSWPGHSCAAGDLRVILKAWTLDDPPDYALFSTAATNCATFYESEAHLPYPVTDPLYRSEWLLMRRIPVGGDSWQVGSENSETGREAAMEHLHHVKFSHDYYMGVFEFTCNQYDNVMGLSYGLNYGKSAKCLPANKLSWGALRGVGADYDWPNKSHAVDPDSILGKVRSLTGQDFDLPTEAQWEVACRAGTSTGLNNGKEYTDPSIDELAWYKDIAEGECHPVGLKRPNAWGLYDMHGNVNEWCLDWMTYDRSSDDGKTDVGGPDGPDETLGRSDYRVQRGGSISEHPVKQRSGRRGWNPEGAAYLGDAGARFCLTLPLK